MRLTKRQSENTSVEIRLRPEIKAAAQAYAVNQGYTSLASMLKVTITQAAEKAHEHLPHPSLVVAKDSWDDPAELYDRDPDLYEMSLDTGVYRLKSDVEKLV